MTKQQLVEAVVASTGAKKNEVEGILQAILETAAETLAKGEKLDWRGFGSFEVKETKARTGRNPATGETITIGAGRKATFKPSKELKQRVTGMSTPVSNS